MSHHQHNTFASRAGLKLDHALESFKLDVANLICADFGCNVGGFTDCLLQHGASQVYAIDTGYGVLDYRLRMNDRVEVLERTNVMHATPRATVDLVTIDLGWTKQARSIPAALRWLKPELEGRIISLIKPHYELTADEQKQWLVDGTLDRERAEIVFNRALEGFSALGVKVIDHTISPITGGKSV